MLNLFVSFLLLYGVKSNILIFNGSGSLLFQKEKQYLKFRVINTLFVSIGTIICLMISYVLYNYIYKIYDLQSLSVVVSVLIVGIWNLLVSKIFGKMSHFVHYLYEKSNSFAVDSVFMLSIIFIVDMANYAILDFAILAATIAIVIFVTSVVFGFFVEDSNKLAIDKHYLNVPSRLFMLAIFSIILYYASLLTL